MQQPMPNPEDITDPTTAMNMALVLMAKAFKLNYSTPTNNNQRISSNPRNRQITQPGMNLGHDSRQTDRCIWLEVIEGISLDSMLGRMLGIKMARDEGYANGNNGSHIRCYNCIGLGDLEEIEEVNANCILMANLQQASTSGIQTDNGRFYDSDGSAEPHMIQQNNSNVIFVESSVEHNGGTVEEHHITIEETRSYFESLYNNLAIEVEKANTVNCKMK
ncbi:hypothetical protein Tco_1162252 [Tanacetum coccineum]